MICKRLYCFKHQITIILRFQVLLTLIVPFNNNQSNTNNFQTDPFDLWMGPLQMQPLRVRVDLDIIAMKRYSPLTRSLK